MEEKLIRLKRIGYTLGTRVSHLKLYFVKSNLRNFYKSYGLQLIQFEFKSILEVFLSFLWESIKDFNLLSKKWFGCKQSKKTAISSTNGNYHEQKEPQAMRRHTNVLVLCIRMWLNKAFGYIKKKMIPSFLLKYITSLLFPICLHLRTVDNLGRLVSDRCLLRCSSPRLIGNQSRFELLC